MELSGDSHFTQLKQELHDGTFAFYSQGEKLSQQGGQPNLIPRAARTSLSRDSTARKDQIETDAVMRRLERGWRVTLTGNQWM